MEKWEHVGFAIKYLYLCSKSLFYRYLATPLTRCLRCSLAKVTCFREVRSGEGRKAFEAGRSTVPLLHPSSFSSVSVSVTKGKIQKAEKGSEARTALIHTFILPPSSFCLFFCFRPLAGNWYRKFIGANIFGIMLAVVSVPLRGIGIERLF